MRLHIALDDDLVAELDRRVGARRRSAFIAELIRSGLDELRWDDIVDALGSVSDSGHEWDDDPAAWVRAQRRSTLGATKGPRLSLDSPVCGLGGVGS